LGTTEELRLDMDRNKAVRIIVLALVAVLVGGVFWLKKTQTGPAASLSPSKTQAVQTAARTASGGSTFSVAPAVSGDLHVTTPIDFNALRSSGLPVIIDFGADSCIPCKEMAPVLVDLNKSLQGKAIIKFVDVWKYKELSEGVPIKVIPTQVFFDSTGKPFNPPDSSSLPFNKYSRNDTKEHAFTTHEGGLDKQQLLAILKEMGMKE
jgi:thioredoxin 1